MYDELLQLKQRHLSGRTGGMVSVCSAHALVLRTAMETVRQTGGGLLVEATANQVNQFGGYTGMTPAQFSVYARQLAKEAGLSQDRLLLGVDHLGPQIWKHDAAETAMRRAEVMIRQCITAGFRKLHLDTASGCADEPALTLPLETTVRRAARLCKAAEAQREADGSAPVAYVVGNEVPIPGGGLESDGRVVVTDSADMLTALEQYRRAFERSGLESAWNRVVAFVVQPGVDFGDRQVAAYRPQRARGLSLAHRRLPGRMTYEIHATDYQTPQSLKQMVRDHFMLLKVGPCLTFAMRRTLYGLARIEAELPGVDVPSALIEVMERLMRARPEYWQSHFDGDPETQRDLRHHSLRDRIRYYWSFPDARRAVDRLMQNLQQDIPAPLLKKHLPEVNIDILRQNLPTDPEAIVRLAVRNALLPYLNATA